jgi:hypothetical protein
MTSREMITDAILESRESVKQDIMNKIDELLESSSMSYLDAKIGLNLIKTFIKFMDEE